MLPHGSVAGSSHLCVRRGTCLGRRDTPSIQTHVPRRWQLRALQPSPYYLCDAVPLAKRPEYSRPRDGERPRNVTWKRDLWWTNVRRLCDPSRRRPRSLAWNTQAWNTHLVAYARDRTRVRARVRTRVRNRVRIRVRVRAAYVYVYGAATAIVPGHHQFFLPKNVSTSSGRNRICPPIRRWGRPLRNCRLTVSREIFR